MAGRKLLLADDSLTIQKVVNLTFVDEGIEVISVGDGESAVRRAHEEMPDIILADVNMPGLTGYQVCEQLRADERTRKIPVVLLIGAFEQFDEEEAARVGASGRITKPFQSIRQFVNQVTDLIEASQPTAATELPSESESIAIEEPTAEMRSSDPFEEPVRSQFESFREDRIASIDQQHELISGPTDESNESAAQAGTAEPDDIDRLYRQSIGEETVPADGDFPDLGVDDEMIETSYSSPQPQTDDLDLIPTFESEQMVEPVGEIGYDGHTVIQDTQPLTANETTNLSVSDIPEVTEDREPARQGETVRLDPSMVDAQMAEVNRRFDPIEQPPPPRSNEPVGEDTIRMDSRFDTKGSASYEFDDIDLLDIPSETDVEITAPPDAAARGGNKQIVTLSPELIEMIAQRVVEKLSEKY